MDIESLQKRFERVSPFLDEKRRRILAAAEAEVLGYGGVTKVARATGLSRVTITQGIKGFARLEVVERRKLIEILP
jgi:AcrR family transcriptional regulator